MAKVARKNGATSNILRVFLQDSSSVLGDGKTGLTEASAGLQISTIADNEATATTYTAIGGTVETITTLGTYAAPTATKCRFKEVDSANHPGVYELQFADARFAVASATSLLITIQGSGILDTRIEVDLRADANATHVQGTAQTARDLGLALPAVAPAAAGGLLISAAGLTGANLDTAIANITTVNGVTFAKVMSSLLAVHAGRVVKTNMSGNRRKFEFYDQAGTAILLTVISSELDGARAASAVPQ